MFDDWPFRPEVGVNSSRQDCNGTLMGLLCFSGFRSILRLWAGMSGSCDGYVIAKGGKKGLPLI